MRVPNEPTGDAGHIVHAVNGLNGKFFKQALLDHTASAARAFLCRLEDQMDGAGEIPRLGKVFRGAEKHRHVAVMTTAMHLALDLRAVRECVPFH